MSKLYIAYGSNLSKMQMRARCPGARVVCKSWLHDYRLVFQGQPYNAHANVIPAEGYSVPVTVWRINAQDEAALDRYEGVKGGYYTKEYMSVEVAGEMREGLIYIMTPHHFGLPAAGYLNIIANGYEDFRFDLNILDEAVSHAYKNTARPVRPSFSRNS